MTKLGPGSRLETPQLGSGVEPLDLDGKTAISMGVSQSPVAGDPKLRLVFITQND